MNTLPRVMVLEYQPELTHAVWVDFSHRCRTVESLVKLIRREIRAGRFSGYRLITIHKEVYGLDSTKPGDLAQAMIHSMTK